MMNQILCLIFLISSFTVNSQKKNILKSNTMEKIELTNENIRGLKENSSYIEKLNDSVIKYTLRGDYYFIQQYSLDNPYKSNKVFYHNGNIRSESYKFYDVPIKKTKMYDEKGNIYKEIDEDKDPKRVFTIDQLIEKIKNEYKIDLLNPRNEDVQYNIQHFFSGKQYVYAFYISNTHSDTYRIIEISSIDGTTVSDKTVKKVFCDSK